MSYKSEMTKTLKQLITDPDDWEVVEELLESANAGDPPLSDCGVRNALDLIEKLARRQ